MSKWIIDQWLWNQSVSTESEWKQRFIYSQLYSGTSPSDRALPKNDLFRALCLGSSGPVWCLWKGRANPQVNTSSMVLFISGACLVFRSWNIQKDFPVCVLPKPTTSTSTAPSPGFLSICWVMLGSTSPGTGSSASFPGLRCFSHIHPHVWSLASYPSSHTVWGGW